MVYVHWKSVFEERMNYHCSVMLIYATRCLFLRKVINPEPDDLWSSNLGSMFLLMASVFWVDKFFISDSTKKKISKITVSMETAAIFKILNNCLLKTFVIFQQIYVESFIQISPVMSEQLHSQFYNFMKMSFWENGS